MPQIIKENLAEYFYQISKSSRQIEILKSSLYKRPSFESYMSFLVISKGKFAISFEDLSLFTRYFCILINRGTCFEMGLDEATGLIRQYSLGAELTYSESFYSYF